MLAFDQPRAFSESWPDIDSDMRASGNKLRKVKRVRFVVRDDTVAGWKIRSEARKFTQKKDSCRKQEHARPPTVLTLN